MSNSIFQNVIVQLRDVANRSFGVMDTDGCVISCTDVSLLGERWLTVPLPSLRSMKQRCLMRRSMTVAPL